MNIIQIKKHFFHKRFLLPLSALIFYLSVFTLWNLKIIPSPSGIVLFLENLYVNYGLTGLFISTFLEGIVYFGLYFPGSFIVALSVFLSDGKFISLLTISIVVALALTITSSINFILGRYIILNKYKRFNIQKNRLASKSLILSMLHPNSLAFYFFNSGIEKQNPLKIALVPVVMIPYGLSLAYLFFFFKSSLRVALESPYIMVVFITIWFIFGFFTNRKN